MKKSIIAILILLPFWAIAQTIDDFSDGNFTDNPTWVGMTDDFIVNQQNQLQLNSSHSGESYLSVATETSDEREWRFWLKLNFAPSVNNLCDVYLCADDADPSQASSGYYIHIGENGSNDAIELRRKDGTSSVVVCRGTDGNVAAAFQVFVKVTRDANNVWSVYTDYTTNNIPVLEAQGTDSTYSNGVYFGFHAKYTTSNQTNFFFDDVYVGPPVIDNDPPQFISHQVIDERRLKLLFDEALDDVSLNVANYDSELQIDSVGYAESRAGVIVYFTNDFVDDVENQITVSNITDLAGNTTPAFTVTFKHFAITYNSVIINEIMADPTPVVALPNYEYIELLNNTANTINLKDWTLKIGTAEKQLTDFELSSGAYLIVCPESAIAEFAEYGTCMGLSSMAITNGGSTISLASPNGTLVSEVTFTDKWYKDSNKKEGGWSLELINPNDLCTNAENNWTASVSPLGGTPGSINSVFNSETPAPVVESMSILSDFSLQLFFNQLMNSETLFEKTNYTILQTNENPASVEVEQNNSATLVFENGFEEGQTYTLRISGLENCAGVDMADTEKTFSIYTNISEGQIVINEILFDPVSTCVDYVELYNNSDLTFDLKNMYLGVVTESFPSPPDTVMRLITSESYLLEPQNYVLLSSDGNAVALYYEVENTDNFITMSSFPSYPNGGGQAILTTDDMSIIDKMNFSEKMHYPLLKITKGVSLERVSPDLASTDASNWHSGSSATNYGTPGYENSVYRKIETNADNVNVEPKTFSPDNDGYNDVCVISINNAEAATVNVRILNSLGAEVRHLVKSELSGSGCSAVWDGLDNSGNRVQTGIYIIYAEWFMSDGSVSRTKNTVVVAAM